MSTSPVTPLDRARYKAYIRLLPLLFLSYAIAYVDRINVSLAALTMSKDLPGFEKEGVIGFGAGVFFIGYFLLEIPGTLLVEKWSAQVDQPDHDFVGIYRRPDGFCKDAASVLRCAIPPWSGRSRVLPGGDCLSDSLVPRP